MTSCAVLTDVQDEPIAINLDFVRAVFKRENGCATVHYGEGPDTFVHLNDTFKDAIEAIFNDAKFSPNATQKFARKQVG